MSLPLFDITNDLCFQDCQIINTNTLSCTISLKDHREMRQCFENNIYNAVKKKKKLAQCQCKKSHTALSGHTQHLPHSTMALCHGSSKNQVTFWKSTSHTEYDKKMKNQSKCCNIYLTREKKKKTQKLEVLTIHFVRNIEIYQRWALFFKCEAWLQDT